jgi:PAS domain S-box-containing protein
VSASVAQLRPDVDPLASLDPVLLHALTSHAHEVVSIVDRGGRVLFSGGAIQRVFGYAPDERHGRPVLDVVHPDDVDYAQARLRELLSDDAIHLADPVTVRVRHKSGEYRHCEITGTRLQRAGSTALLVLHTRDVTAQAQAMARSAAAEVRLELAIEGADLGLWEFHVADWRLTRTEDWFERHDLPCLVDGRESADWYDRIHPDDIARVQQTIAARLAGSDTRPHLQYRILNRSGRWTWLDEYASVIARNPDGTARILAGVCACADETKALEQELSLANERLRLAIDASGVAMWDWRVEDDVVFRTRAWGALLREPPRCEDFWCAYGAPELETMHPDDRPQMLAAYEAHARGAGPGFSYEARRRCGDGSWRWMRSMGRAVERDAGGRPLRVVGCTIDVHERRLAEERLAESELRFRTAAGLARGHVAEIAVGPDGRLRLPWCSDGLPAMLACGRDELDAGWDAAGFVHPDDRAAFLALQAEALAGRPREAAMRLLGRDGCVVSARIAMAPAAFGPDARVTRLLATVLEDGAPGGGGLLALHQALLEHVPVCVVLLDAGRRIRFANPLLGRLFPGAATGRAFEACFDPRSQPAVAAALARSRDTGRDVELEALAPAAPPLAGRSYRLHVAPVAPRSGFDGWCALVRDVTDSRDAELKSFAAIGRDPQRIGHELHDGVGQQLTGAVLLAQTLATELAAERHRLAGDVERVAGLLNQSIDDVRMLARSLSPVGSAPTGLRAAMHALAARARSLGELVVDLHLAIHPGHALSAVESDHLYWIAQEAVANAMRHAAATHLELGLEIDGEGFELRIGDDGRGAGPADAAAREAGLGLRLMAHRARGLGANFTVTPRPGGGTLVTCLRRSRG